MAKSTMNKGTMPNMSESELRMSKRDRNLDQQGRQGNIAQNTTHQGHQQDR